MSKSMKQVVYQGVGEPLAVCEGQVPTPGEGQLLLRVKACGICGSDLHFAQKGIVPAGTVLGHEFSGEVAAVGVGVAGDWQPGDRAIALPILACGKCVACMQGNPKLCPTMVPLGHGHPEGPGAYAEYLVVEAGFSIKVPDAVSSLEAACIEPFVVGLYALRRARLRAAENVLVIGAGPIGLAVASWSKFFGAGKVVVSERTADRRALASKLGADAVIDASIEQDVMAAFVRETGTTPDLIVEAVGMPGLIQQCIHMAPAGCRILVAGACMEPDTIVPMEAIFKDLQLIFVYGYELRDYKFTLEMTANGRLEPGLLFTHQVSLDELPTAFEALMTPTDQCKVVVVP